MKANELRIGNLIHYIVDDDICVNKVDCQDIKYAYENNVVFNINHKPIELTEEWLVKLGFEIYGSTAYKTVKDYDFEFLKISNILTIMPPDGFSRGHEIDFPCAYLHQLQNLYFALTGEEIEIKQIQL